MNEQIVYNAIRTPDGTELVSYTSHDYKTYLDTISTEMYMVDGGTDYLRRSAGHTVDYEELSVYADDDHVDIREVVVWGTYGKDGKQPLKFKRVSHMSTGHIEAVLETQALVPWRRKIFEDELLYRRD